MNDYKQRRLATLDLGSNSLLLLIAERDENGRITVLAEESATPRLSEGVQGSGKISPQVMRRVCTALQEFVKKARAMDITDINIVTTQAAREATNQAELLEQIQQSTGLEAQVLSPIEEARLTYTSVATEYAGEAPSMVVDIGGGSTEITWGLGPRFDGGRSLPIGTVKLLEGALKNECPSSSDLDQARKEIDAKLARVTPLGKLDNYFGTAGSFTHLASVDLKVEAYHPQTVTGHQLTPEMVQTWIEKLSSMTREQLLELPGIDPSRADVLLSGTLMIERLFAKFKNPHFTVVDRGIRFGKLFDRLHRFVPPVQFG